MTTEQTEQTIPDLRNALFQAQHWCATLVAGTPDAQLAQPTPCAEFDVRQLITHLALVFEKVTAFGEIKGDPWFGKDLSPEEMERIRDELSARYVDARSPAERAHLLSEQSARARELWVDDLLDEPVQLGWGPVLPGRVVAGIYLMECLAHGWDLATATGQDAEAPQHVAKLGLHSAVAGLPREPRGVEFCVPFGPVVEAAPDAGPTEQLANWTGRVSRG